MNLQKLHVEWYAWTMGDGPKPSFLEKAVAYYVMGAERWRYADSLDAVCRGYLKYQLYSSTNPDDVFKPGSLVPDGEGGGGP